MDLSTSLESYWKLDETSGTRVDSHGSRNWTNVGTVSNAGGVISNALSLSGGGNLNRASDSTITHDGTRDISYSLWVYFANVSGVKTVLSKWGNVATRQEYILYGNGTNLVWQQANSSAMTQTSISATTWYHVVVTMSSGLVGNLYVNGSHVASTTGSAFSGTGTSDLRIGQNTNTNYFSGRVDEVGCWSRILDATDASKLYNSGSGLDYAGILADTDATPSGFQLWWA